ncbi:hypothetical protein [Streptomyces virginiae]|uniref:hypothetical protein n=1 Tax=Streptomyces virginiae TaxID=1961 RepID=UPI002DDADC9B|nr:hypothetical protein [Streptomyces virginiae]WSC78197.1 hypothetical protein OHA56_18790 [Streptomyces virginiae]
MRTTRTTRTTRSTATALVASATAVAALLTLTACGGDGSGGSASSVIGGPGADGGTGAATDGGPDEGTLENPTKNGGVNGNAPKDGTAFQKLPKAATMAAAARFVNGFTPCDPIKTVPAGSHPSTGPDEKLLQAGTVIERGTCGSRGRTSIYMIKDAKAFQTAFKAETDAGDGGGNPNQGIVVGQDFAMGSESSDAMSALLQPQAGLLMLNCHPDFKPPSGYRKEPALVKGCVLTDYYVD